MSFFGFSTTLPAEDRPEGEDAGESSLVENGFAGAEFDDEMNDETFGVDVSEISTIARS